MTNKMTDQHIGAYDNARRLVCEAVKKAAALSTDPTLMEWAKLDDPAQLPRDVVDGTLRAAWPDAPGTDLPAIQATLQKVGDEADRVRRIQDAAAVDPAAMPVLTANIVRHAIYAVRALRTALQPPASAEQTPRSALTQGIAESVVALAEHVEWMRKFPKK